MPEKRVLGDVLRRVRTQPVLQAVVALLGAAALWALVSPIVFAERTPVGVLLLGAALGSLNALLGMGLVLIYRTNRIVNFAHGSMGGLAAVVFVEIVFKGLNYLVAVPLCLVLAAGFGALLEVTIIRRFSASPRLIATVATIGLDQVLGALSLVLPLVFDRQVSSLNFKTPLSRFRWNVAPVIFDGNYLLIIVVVIAASIGVTWFLRTRYGTAVRAAAENADRAALSGVPVKSLTTLVWAVAAAMSAAAAMLQAPVVGFRTGFLVGPGLLVPGLAAAVVGRMRSLPVTAATAIALGIFSQAVFWDTGDATIVSVLSLAVILGAFVVQRRSFGRAESDESSSWQAVAPVRPLPTRIARLPEVRALNAVGATLTAVAVLAAPLLVSEARRALLSAVVIYGIVGLSLVVLTGWAGQISLGQFALVGLGAAVAGSLTSRAGFDFAVGIVGGMAAGVLAALLLGLPALRVRGLFLAVTTLAFAVATSSFVLSLDWLVPVGLVDRPVLFGRFDLHSDTTYYYLCLAALGLVIVAMRLYRNSQVWRTIAAVRDNERAAQSYGVSPVVAKLTAFAISGAIAGLAGALLVHQQYRLQGSQYDASQSLVALTMTVIGGLGSVSGALLGAAYVKGVQYFLPSYGALLSSGVGLIVLLLLLPRGLGAAIFSGRDGLALWLGRRRDSETSR